MIVMTMKTPRISLVALPTASLLLLFSACGGGTSAPAPKELKSEKVRMAAPDVPAADAQELAAGNAELGFALHAQLRDLNAGQNFLFSQTSISLALAMLYAGAGPGSTTAQQMASTLHFTLPPDRLHAAFNALDLALATPPAGAPAGAFRLSIANGSWAQDGFPILPSYLDLLAENYGAGQFITDFLMAPEAARAEINGWVSDRTEHKIPELFPKGTIDSSTVLALANAVFFHGDWQTPFKAPSSNGTFHAAGGDVSVPMMVGTSNATLWSGTGWSAASLAYVGGTTSMLVVVPDAGTFDAFEQTWSSAKLTEVLQGPTTLHTGDLVLPKFDFATNAPLADTLAAMGMPDAFTPAADFSGIDGARDLIVQSVIHKAVIAVDEKGTTAAAATGISVGTTSVRETLVVDRPFLFLIRHEPTGAILFQGRVLDPSRS